jgi:DNA polymerase-4
VTIEDADPAVPLPLQRKIIHVDMDAFYASVEQRDNPDLRGKPVAVGGSRERGVVAAASYEARKFGVRSAMPSVTAKRQCPGLIFVKPRFEVYKEISQQIREIFAEHTPIIEPLSLDEAYLDVTENLQGLPLARDVALAIRARIKQETGLNASAGISYNKFLAKLASDHRKPNGQYVITPEMWASVRRNLGRRQISRHRSGDQREDEFSRDLHRHRHTKPVPRVHASELREGRYILLLDFERR